MCATIIVMFKSTINVENYQFICVYKKKKNTYTHYIDVLVVIYYNKFVTKKKKKKYKYTIYSKHIILLLLLDTYNVTLRRPSNVLNKIVCVVRCIDFDIETFEISVNELEKINKYLKIRNRDWLFKCIWIFFVCKKYKKKTSFVQSRFTVQIH